MSEPQLCKDCRFAVNDHPGYKSSVPRLEDHAWRCRHPSATRPAAPPSPVTGFVEPPEQMTCTEARGYGMTANCGPDGRFWEAREIGIEVIGFDTEVTDEAGERRWADNIEDAFANDEDGEAFEWTVLSARETGLPFPVRVCDIKPAVVVSNHTRF